MLSDFEGMTGVLHQAGRFVERASRKTTRTSDSDS